jgi:hypothetical protein
VPVSAFVAPAQLRRVKHAGHGPASARRPEPQRGVETAVQRESGGPETCADQEAEGGAEHWQKDCGSDDRGKAAGDQAGGNRWSNHAGSGAVR